MTRAPARLTGTAAGTRHPAPTGGGVRPVGTANDAVTPERFGTTDSPAAPEPVATPNNLRPTRPAARTSAALVLTLAALASTAAPAHALPQPMSQCTTSSGAVLAVDFSRWGGPIYRSCGTTPTTGYELLNQGGWATTGTGHDGPAFICRIGYSGFRAGRQFPPPEQDDCVLTPPASAYWSYWHANPGQNTWEYSQLGAMLYKPRPGSVDLWIFGGTNIEGTKGRPTVTPDQLRAKNTRPTSNRPVPKDTRTAKPLPPNVNTGPAPVNPPPGYTPPPAAPPVRREAGGPGTVPVNPNPPAVTPSSPPGATDTPAPTPTAAPTAPGAPTPASTAAVVAAGSRPKAEIADAPPAADAPYDVGSYLPAAGAGALVLLIAGGAVFTARRRRRTTESG
ncbi:hypothetical protein GCM10010329_51980 [Streptomyces spiroverticillatus]|uniref:Uncharacterized protein n=1 Tax=Streptomyces finlayi TaxID=67296 RepID=A0A918X203_9ACTN|nr:hypothetical protein [Streptomyces finlayi]GHA22249.1 hypothetical protein GCM10010329_51980 [Streptomyces spiroverticillatus]GHD04295.1 hypothetical protein GCM10010334_52920 [Streptomyces finlayi]